MPRIAFTLVGTSVTTMPMAALRITFRPESGTCVSADNREPVVAWFRAVDPGAGSCNAALAVTTFSTTFSTCCVTSLSTGTSFTTTLSTGTSFITIFRPPA